MSQQGWIKIHRKLKECYLWEDKEPFDKRSAWIDLLLSVNHADNKTIINNKVELVKRGTFITSEVKLSERWKWDRGKVRRFLKLLESDNMLIKTARARLFITIEIVNYIEYQSKESATSESVDITKVKEVNTTSNEQVENKSATSNEQVTNINKNDKNDKETIYSEDFESFYKLYPRPINKELTYRSYLKVLKKESPDVILKATKNYINDILINKTDKRFFFKSTNFLGEHAEYKGFLETDNKLPTGIKVIPNNPTRRADM